MATLKFDLICLPYPQTMVYKYNEEEWTTLVAAEAGWTREETDYLLDMCGLYQLRFLVIADRYQVHYLATQFMSTL